MTTRSGVSSNSLLFEANEFAKHFAVFLTANSKSKLERRKVSELFVQDRREADIFFEHSELAVAARSAAPVKETPTFLGFVHKSIQEYYVAQMIVANVTQAAHECTALSKKKILEWNTIKGIPDKVLTDRKAYLTLLRKVEQGPLFTVNLLHESAVIDFIADNLLGSVDVVKAFQLVYKAARMIAATKDDVRAKEEISKE